MAVIRQQNWLGQQRVDVPHLRALESAVAADFDLFAGDIFAGKQTLVIKGFEILNADLAPGKSATDLQIAIGGGIMMHPLASESGTIFTLPDATPAETLNATNPNVQGSFTPSQTNYIGLDLVRSADPTTTDLVMFLNADTLQETPKSVPLARTLKHKILISTTPFEGTPDVLPLAKVVTDALNVVTSVEDCRRMAFSLRTGGSVPDQQHAHAWTQGRNEKVNDAAGQVFQGGDKILGSFKSWMDAVMTRLWEIGGGEFWYSATTDRDLKVAYGQPTLLSNNDNWDWNLGTNTLSWAGITILFGASTGWYNTVTDGSIVLADGECAYVDVNRATNGAAVAMGKVAMTALLQPAIPTSRLVLAWRKGNYVFTRERNYEVNRTNIAATTTVAGVVKLNAPPVDPVQPVVTVIDSFGNVVANGLSLGAVGGGDLGIGTDASDGLVEIGHAGSMITLGGDFIRLSSAGASIEAESSILRLGTDNTVTTGGVLIGSAGKTTTIQGTANIATLDRAGSISIGAATATAIGIGKAGVTTSILGTADIATLDRAGTIDIGGVTGTAIGISRTGQTTTIKGSLSVLQNASITGTLGVTGAATFGNDVSVPAANNFKYAAARTFWIHVGALDIQVDPAGLGAAKINYSPGGGVPPFWFNTAAGAYVAYARVRVPAGATVTGMKINVTNNTGGAVALNTVQARIYTASAGSFNAAAVMCNGSTAVIANGATLWVDAPAWTNQTMPADGDGFVHIVIPMMSSTATSQAFLNGVKLSYTMTNIAPMA